ncbi:UDP-N-acetylmuramoyl-L-alanine--D-glutamate ligase [Vandammella animalimorsus]|uniref:UDP-N-acetylmuramoylalanine--D-glutamate ligase n=2 Tax=Vandammella animalimorsus TaxID=2029117 RepID=A0A2A2T7M4_9BURK|nr:UDP-N-acetylmuramoyl-L-alanine--D-glutamate ligase [Vandammella animalimorsus]PAX17868.1 UDP-N-acetylmuramoyl-L-alanine--D-glutamate ligase [Vandammella animalimorsus]PAX20023.1 UDP-N-acetylmuramoyl-L-alanine--D-glutamate ligase [Vandammella animalimorsus]
MPAHMPTTTTNASPLVLILGLGISGLAMARWCASQGQRVRVADTRAAPPGQQALQQLPGVECRFGQPLQAQLLCSSVGHVEVSAVYCSPGLAPTEVAAVREAAARSGVFFGGELDLFTQALRHLRQQHHYQPRVLAITGTNGKTTVTSLTAQLLERAGQHVAVAGNIGPSLLDTLAQCLAQAEAAAQQEEEPQGQAQPALAAPSAEQETGADLDAGPEAEADTDTDTDADGEAQPLVAAAQAGPDALARALPQTWVLELSSFQLDYSSGFEPTAGVILNISQDHLDWHGSQQAYVQAKAKVYGQQGVVVMNRDDATLMALLPELTPAPAAKSPRGGRAAAQRQVLHFGLQAPQQWGDWGVVVEHGMPWLATTVGEAPPAGRSGQGRKAQAGEWFVQRLMPADAMRIRGQHNVANALAALALASTTGAALAPMLHGLREYRGEPHRVQSLGLVQGVEYIDDSKGTNVGATAAALCGLVPDARASRRLVVILGGLGKGQDFSPLREPVRQAARAVLLIGQDAPAIAQALQGCGVPLVHADGLPEAVAQAAALAQPGDAVLLSPACASMDMFRDYAHRAQVFADSVQALALDAGQSLEAWT